MLLRLLAPAAAVLVLAGCQSTPKVDTTHFQSQPPAWGQRYGHNDGQPLNLHRSVAAGIQHRFLATGGEAPRVWNIATVDLQEKGILIEAEKASDKLAGNERLADMAQRLADPLDRPLLLLNADFWAARGVPVNLFVDEGMIWKKEFRRGESRRAVFAWDEAGNHVITLPELRASVVLPDGTESDISDINASAGPGVRVWTWPLEAEAPAPPEGSVAIGLRLERPEWLPNAPARATVVAEVPTALSAKDRAALVLHVPQEAAAGFAPGTAVELRATLAGLPGKVVGVLGGGPTLLRAGEVVVDEADKLEGFGEGFLNTPHPRTALGLKDDGRTLVLVTVDGRQTGRSSGASLALLASFMKEQGCTEAMNLDGGGSTTMVVLNEVVNFPSDAAGARPISTALVVRKRGGPGNPASLDVLSPKYPVPQGALVPFRPFAHDEVGNPTTLAGWEVRGKVVEGKGRLTPDGFFRATEEGTSTVRFTARQGSARVDAPDFTVTAQRPARLRFEPDALFLRAGEETTVRLVAEDAAGNPLHGFFFVPNVHASRMYTWDQGARTLRAHRPGADFLEVSLAGRHARLPIAVERFAETVLFDFDATETLPLAEGVKSRVVPDATNPKQGTGCWKVEYDLRGLESASVTIPVDAPLGDLGRALGIYAEGDGAGLDIRAILVDSAGTKSTVRFAPSITWEGEWRLCKARHNGSRLLPPLRLAELQVLQQAAVGKKAGTIRLDGLMALNLPPELAR